MTFGVFGPLFGISLRKYVDCLYFLIFVWTGAIALHSTLELSLYNCMMDCMMDDCVYCYGTPVPRFCYCTTINT